MKKLMFVLMAGMVAFSSCSSRKSNEIIIFHAGSLAVPMARLAEEYMSANPDIKIVTEAAGSLVSARKITELGKPCDIMASADYQIIDNMLIPEYASWNLGFATNEIVIAYTDKSRYNQQITSENWFEILQRGDVVYGRSDPDSDPCGYRTLLMLKLAEKVYEMPGLTGVFETKDRSFIRPKETDLTALLEAGAVDYVFQYRSVAVQHGLLYINLPPSINLGSTLFSEKYQEVSQDVVGSKPGEKISIQGDYIMYGITILKEAPNREAAERFLAFLAGKRGSEILAGTGQNPITPPIISGTGKIPAIVLDAIQGR
ncbi:MAG: tungstate ABC transporter substrate-binding protein WtpA [Bacteroidales bacterium]|nr:tungstate ABC transporter substrate-binding protein WtpA [Bacteroidales bacterium]